ncbi:MAG: hypothetical protein ACOZAP_08730 [Pseudomonadota bacterium]
MEGQAVPPDQKKEAVRRRLIDAGDVQAMSELPGRIQPIRPLRNDDDG